MEDMFANQEVKDELMSQFLDNECGSDEYGETAPWKTFDLLSRCECFVWGDQFKALMLLASTWLSAFEREGCVRYAGLDEAVPLYEMIFNILWSNKEHPYYSKEELPAILEEMKDY